MSVLLFTELQDLFWTITQTITQLPAVSIRFPYQEQSQPGWTVDQDVVFINVTVFDDPYDKLRDITYKNSDVNNAEEEIGYTRVMQVEWNLYGPNGFDLADALRSGILTNNIREILSQQKVFPLTEIASPIRVPYDFENQWWQRNDLRALFNVTTIRSSIVPYLQFADILVYDYKGLEETVHVHP